jgi:hypothetical protein
MRHIPEAGAVCGNPARTDLRGGQGVTSVPTATLNDSFMQTLTYTTRLQRKPFWLPKIRSPRF